MIPVNYIRERLIKFIVENGKLLLLLSCLLVLVSIPFIFKVRIDPTVATFYPPKSDPDRIFLEKTYRDFESGWGIVIIINHDKIFSSPTLKKIQTLTSQIEGMTAVDYVLSITNANIVKSSGDEIRVSNRSDSIPKSAEEIEQFKNDILNNPLYTKSLVSGDLKTTAISVLFDETRFSHLTIGKTVEDIQRITNDYAGPEKVYVGGLKAVTAASYDMLVKDLSTLLPLCLLIMVAILFIYFFNWRLIMVSVISVLIAVGFTYAIMALFNVPISLLGVTIPGIITALALSYLIRLFSEYSRQRASESQPKVVVGRTLNHVLTPIFLATITTAIGFYSISPVDIVSVRQFGLLLAVGVLLLFVVIALFVSPVLVYLFPRTRTQREAPSNLSGNRLGRFSMFFTRHRLVLLFITVTISATSVIGITKLNVESNFFDYFRSSSPIMKTVGIMRDKLKNSTSIDVFIEGTEKGSIEDPEVLRAIEELQTFTNNLPYVGKTISIVDYIKQMNTVLHDGDPAYDALPNDKEEIARYLFAYSVADPQKILDRYIDYDHKNTRMSIGTSFESSKELLEFKRLIENQCEKLLPPSVTWRVTGEFVLIAIASNKLSRGILIGFTQAGLAIFVIMLLLFRSFKIGIAAMIPNLLPILVVLGFMGYIGIPFNAATSIVVCIALGIAVDDTIHFLVRFFNELKNTKDQTLAISNTCNHEGRPIIKTAIILALGFAILVFSQFIPIAMFGILIALAMIIGALCELTILPALLASMRI
jgi:predicted RND superfamily exporter protein